jgi:hypothetical protein
MPTPSAAARTAEGRFAPGVSGNPNGRPRGRRNYAGLLEEALRDGEAEAIVRVAIEGALAGDRSLIRFFLGRMCPAMRGRLVELELPEHWDGDASSFVTAVLRAVAEGRLTAEEAGRLGRVLKIGEGLPNGKQPVSDLFSGAATPGKAKATAALAAEAPRSVARPPAPAGVGAAGLPAWLKPGAPATAAALFSSCSPLSLAA